ncbi:MAG: hypothetical protein AABX02_02500 [archaeon]
MPTKSLSEDANGNTVLPSDDLQELLRPGKEFESKLTAAIKALPLGTTHLLLVRVADYATAGHTILRHFSAQKMPGVYVTINKPYLDLVKGLVNPPENVQYVDAITALTGRDMPETPRITYLDSPLSLVELNLAIAEKLRGIASNAKFLVMDSISTLLVYNAAQAVEKFCHTVIAKNRTENIMGLFLMVESEENQAVVDTLSQFVDGVIRIG